MTNLQPSRGIRKERVGHVVSDKMDKTIVVRVDRRVRHAKYNKVITLASRFYAHDEKNEAKIGDRVRIIETRPLSRLKRWRLEEVLEKGSEQVSLSAESEVEVSSAKDK
jgi:small subunit ribosomal protein S17